MNILFLDDDPLRHEAFVKLAPSARRVKTAAETIAEIQAEVPDALFLDHDLGGEVYVDSDREDTGMEVVRWLEQNPMPIGLIVVHSYNTVAAKRMGVALLEKNYDTYISPFGSSLFQEIVRQLV